MGKLLPCDGSPLVEPFPQKCHSSSMETWRENALQLSLPAPPPALPPSTTPESSESDEDDNNASTVEVSPYPSWEAVSGLESQQIQALLKYSSRGVYWKHPSKPMSCTFTLHHGGDVEADGNCLFSAAQKAMSLTDESPESVRVRTVKRFLHDYEEQILPKDSTDRAIKHLYCPDLATGWGVHVIQEVKLLAKKSDRESMDAAIQELVQCGVSSENAAETVYKERCLNVDNGENWAKYMSIAGDANDKYDIVTLIYTQEGLISIDENREGKAAAFGDDIAIESLASEFQREIFVVQAHGADAMVDEENCIFFLSHRPRGEIQHHPVFLFMKGTGWCGSGADHYEPMIPQPAPSIQKEKAALVL